MLFDAACPPAYSTMPTEGASNRLANIEVVAAELGLDLMPHQRHCLAVLTERGDDGTPRYWNSTLTMPRRNGKTTIVLLMILDRLLFWGSRQQVIYVAQTIGDAKHVWGDELWPLLQDSGLARAFRMRFYTGMADIHLAVRGTGSTMRVLTTNSRATGHGSKLGLAVHDEAFAAQDNSTETALRPALATVPDSQFIVTSTAGDATSTYLRRRIDAGRDLISHAAESDHRAAYIEWAADPDAEPYDETTWQAAMPALGRTYSMDRARADAADADERLWRRAYLNQWVTSAKDPIFADASWRACRSRRAETRPQASVVLGIDCAPGRERASIVACDADGNAEVVASKAGVGWLVDEAARIAYRHRDVNGIVLLGGNMPTASMIDDVVATGVAHQVVLRPDYVAACQMLTDAVAQQQLNVYESQLYPRIRIAVAGAIQQGRGGYIWAADDLSVDITPLVALTLAYWAARRAKIAPALKHGVIDLDNPNPEAVDRWRTALGATADA